MNTIPRQLRFLCSSYGKAEDSLLTRTLIGQSVPIRTFSTTARCAVRPAGKRWIGRGQGAEKIRRPWSARFQHTWEQIQSVATSPKRSNTGPLLGALFGAGAIASLGAAFIPHEQEEENAIPSTDVVDVADKEGTLIIYRAVSTAHFEHEL